MKTVEVRGGNRPFRMPANELAPGMILAQHYGQEGTFFISSDEIKFDPTPKHPPFSKYLRAELEPIRKVFQEVYSNAEDREKWEYGFRADIHPWREMAVWAVMADAYRELLEAAESSFSAWERKQIFEVLVQTSLNGDNAKYTCESKMAAESMDVIFMVLTIHFQKSYQFYFDKFRAFFGGKPPIPDGPQSHSKVAEAAGGADSSTPPASS